MATTQYTISANTSTSTQAAAADTTRRYMIIQNYQNATVNSGQGTMYVAFGVAATAGTNGELEIPPGAAYVFGGKLDPSKQTLPGSFFLPNTPTEAVNVISVGGTAVGSIITQ